MKLSYAYIAAALIAAMPLGSCRSDSGRDELAHHHDHGHDHEAENHDHEAEEPGHSHESVEEAHDGEIVLAPEKGERFGVKVAEAAETPFSEVIVVSGQIVPSPSETSVVAARSAGIVRLAAGIAPGAKVSKGATVATVSAQGMSGGDPNESARVALEAARRELDRLTPLHEEGIVSTRDYNAARQRYDEARVAAGSRSGAGSAATAATSGIITNLLVGQGQYVEAGQPIAEISGSKRLTLRADLPEGKAASAARVTGASFRPSYSSETVDLDKLNGRRVSGDPYAAANGGYIPLYFDFASDGSVVSGAFCEVYLRGAEKGSALTVPLSALSEQQGQMFVYVEAHPGAYRKQPVTIGSNDGHRVEILSGLRAGERFVADGVTFVRLAETSDVKPEGHTHSH